MQFLTIVLLCALGTWVYSGLDGAWRMLDLSAETYFQQGRAVGFLDQPLSGMTKADLDHIAHTQGVADVQGPLYQGIWIAPPWGRMSP